MSDRRRFLFREWYLSKERDIDDVGEDVVKEANDMYAEGFLEFATGDPNCRKMRLTPEGIMKVVEENPDWFGEPGGKARREVAGPSGLEGFDSPRPAAEPDGHQYETEEIPL